MTVILWITQPNAALQPTAPGIANAAAERQSVRRPHRIVKEETR
jgi:hypothetical protein